MLFIAPIVSKTLHTSSHATSAMSPKESMSMPSGDECSMMSSSSSSQPPAFDRKMLDDMACGYCQLLAHFPFLQWVILLALVIIYCPLRIVTLLPLTFHPLTGYRWSNQARAPPSL